MYIAFDYPSLTSSGGGAAYECLYVAPPPELVNCGGTSSINIPRLWCSGTITLIK